jgi:hypothetical protein
LGPRLRCFRGSSLPDAWGVRKGDVVTFRHGTPGRSCYPAARLSHRRRPRRKYRRSPWLVANHKLPTWRRATGALSGGIFPSWETPSSVVDGPGGVRVGRFFPARNSHRGPVGVTRPGSTIFVSNARSHRAPVFFVTKPPSPGPPAGRLAAFSPPALPRGCVRGTPAV